MENQESFMKLQMLQNEGQKLEEQIQLIDQQSSELSSIKECIENIEKEKSQSNEILTNLGKGIFVKTLLKEKELYVNVGKEIIIKKNTKETIKIIDEQISKLSNAKVEMFERVQNLQEEMQNLFLEVQRSSENHKHDENCKH